MNRIFRKIVSLFEQEQVPKEEELPIFTRIELNRALHTIEKLFESVGYEDVEVIFKMKKKKR
jgi:hypothetical protein